MDKSLIELNAGQKFLVTCDKWFYAPDGKQYRAVWGEVSVHADADTLGIKTNHQSSNWYVLIGSAEKRMVVAGCQIHYAALCPVAPPTEPMLEKKWHEAGGVMLDVMVDSYIYLAQ